MALKVSNRFYVTAINDSSSISVVLHSDIPLTQEYNTYTDPPTCVPDWSVAANQPTAYALVRVNGALKSPNLNSSVWLYNNITLTFDESTGISTGTYAGLFQKTIYNNVSEGVTNMPALKILGNLVSSSNQDQDVITLTGTVELSGAQCGYSVSIPVRYSKVASSGYFGVVGGESYINSSKSTDPGYTADMEATLYNGDDTVKNFKTIWYREGISEAGVGNWPKTVFSNTTTGVASCSITEPDVLDYVVIRVEFYIPDESDNTVYHKVFTAFWDVDDMQDPEEMFIVHGANNQNNASLRTGETVDFRMWMARSTDPYAFDSRFTHFYVKMLNSEGNFVKCSLVDPETDHTIQVDTAQGEEVVDITYGLYSAEPPVGPPTVPTSGQASNVTGGRVLIGYNFAYSLGSEVSGIVIATDTAINT